MFLVWNFFFLTLRSTIWTELEKENLIPTSLHLIGSGSFCEFAGDWILNLDLSENSNDLYSFLDIGWSKRRILNKYRIQLYFEIEDCGCDIYLCRNYQNVKNKYFMCNLSQCSIYLKSKYPFNHSKTVNFRFGKDQIELNDKDTGYWKVTSDWQYGFLLQKRVSAEYGVMYDMRKIININNQRKKKFLTDYLKSKDTTNTLESLTKSELLFFRWVLIKPDSEILIADKWFERKN